MLDSGFDICEDGETNRGFLSNIYITIIEGRMAYRAEAQIMRM
jgi:hypothetical protein